MLFLVSDAFLDVSIDDFNTVLNGVTAPCGDSENDVCISLFAVKVSVEQCLLVGIFFLSSLCEVDTFDFSSSSSRCSTVILEAVYRLGWGEDMD